MQDKAAFCAEHGIDMAALDSLLGFLLRHIQSNPEARALFLAHPDAFLTAGVQAWHRQSREFFEELLAGETEQAKAWRAEIAHNVYSHHIAIH